LQLYRRIDHVETWSPPYVAHIVAAMQEIRSSGSDHVRVRRCETQTELATSADVYNRVWPRAAITLEEAEAWRAGNDETLEAVGELDGEVVGSAVVAIGPPRPDWAFTLITVLPAARRQGVGTALYEAVSAWARERGRDTLDTYAREEDPVGLDYALRRRFVEDSREAGLELRLEGIEPPAVEPPDGIELVTLAERPELARPLYDVACESFPDVPGAEDEVMRPREDWIERHLYAAGSDPAVIWIAVADDDAVGYAKLRISPARPGAATHGMTAVKRAWRGRGVASALKRAQIRWASEHGIDVLETANELRNAPMRAVNLKLGYTPAPGRVHLVGPAASDET
jgi:GNAT superfamily N-acetyltransferase